MSSHRPRGAKRPLWLLTTAVALVATAGLATLAVAKPAKKPKPLITTTHDASLKATILVDSSGMTLYELRPETSRHLLCTTSLCFQFWPPGKVGKTTKLVKGSGVKGSLGRLHRDGFYQLTLDGHPLYRFSGDTHKGSHLGNGITSFGGSWHVVSESRSSKTTTATTTTATSTTTSSPYSYPGY